MVLRPAHPGGASCHRGWVLSVGILNVSSPRAATVARWIPGAEPGSIRRRRNATGAGKHVETVFAAGSELVTIPAWVVDYASFRRWMHSDEFPEKGPKMCVLNGKFWVDLDVEEFSSHNAVKTEVGAVLHLL